MGKKAYYDDQCSGDPYESLQVIGGINFAEIYGGID
jgi:hypothetical protein